MKSYFFLFFYIGGYELLRLSNLEHLDLGYNQFDNSILSFMKGFSSFKSLYLGYNRLKKLTNLKG
jgi:Leucine-rich repeat (LRR) protein